MLPYMSKKLCAFATLKCIFILMLYSALVAIIHRTPHGSKTTRFKETSFHDIASPQEMSSQEGAPSRNSPSLQERGPVRMSPSLQERGPARMSPFLNEGVALAGRVALEKNNDSFSPGSDNSEISSMSDKGLNSGISYGQCAQNVSQIIPELEEYYSVKANASELTWSYSNFSAFCSDTAFTMPLPQFLPSFRSPCWLQEWSSGEVQLKCMPSVFLAGIMKCGTSDLWASLTSHPMILNRDVKEPHYWTREIAVDASASTITGAVNTPKHKHPNTVEEVIPGAIRRVLPKSKFIVLFRDPVERLYSDYMFFGLVTSISPERFHNASVEAVACMKNCFETLSEKQCVYLRRQLPERCLSGLHLNVGLYAIFLRDWMAAGFAKDQFHFIRTEDYGRNRSVILRDIADFIGIDRTGFNPPSKPQNARGKKKIELDDMLPETRRLLRAFYAPYNHELADFLGDDNYTWGY